MTLVIIDGSVVTVASVGDSRCVLEAEGSIYYLSADHRFDASVEEYDCFLTEPAVVLCWLYVWLLSMVSF